jgi:hypothetical protein
MVGHKAWMGETKDVYRMLEGINLFQCKHLEDMWSLEYTEMYLKGMKNVNFIKLAQDRIH